MKSKINFNKIAIGLSVVMILLLLIRFAFMDVFFALEPDETTYYAGAHVFAATNSVKAHSITSEDVSKYFQADWYGIFYPMFYGGVMKIIGTYSKAFIVTNILLCFLIVIIIIKTKLLEPEERWGLLAITVSSPVLMMYSFYFMPMVLNTFFAFILILYLLKLNKGIIDNNQAKLNGNIFKYVILVILFSLFRVTFVFWIIGIIPFSTNRKQALRLTLLCLISIVFVVVYMKFFNAPSYATHISVIQYLFQLDFYHFFMGIVRNVIYNILDGPLNFKSVQKVFIIPYYFTLIAPFYFVYKYYFREKNTLLLSIACICLLSNLISIFFYYLNCWVYMRLSLQLFTALCFIVILDKTLPAIFKILFIGSLVLSSGFAVAKSFQEFDKREQSGLTIKNDFYLSFNDLKNKIDEQPVTTILTDRIFIFQHPSSEFELALPYYTNKGNIIRYTYNMREKDPLELHHKLKIDYILSPDSLKNPNFTYIYSNKHYHLYKIK